jgi:hypothetical protein
MTMRNLSYLTAVSAAVLGIVSARDARADLTHRYPFNESFAATIAEDVVGDADGQLMGGTAFTGDGRVFFDGVAGSYVDLPGGIITGYTAVTMEAWVNVSASGNWTRIYDFGDINQETSLGRHYIMLTPHSGSSDIRMSIAGADPGYDREEWIARPGVISDQGDTHVAAVYDPLNGFGALYINGKLAAYRKDLTITLDEVNNVYSFIGRSLYASDSPLFGDIDEFRIYNHALHPAEVAASFAAGPNTPATDPGALQSINLDIPSNMLLEGVQEVVVIANYAVAGAVDISFLDNIAVSSSAPEVVEVADNGTLRALSLGTAEITATYEGQTTRRSVTVLPGVAILKHRYSFNGTSPEIAEDSVGGADGVVLGGAAYNGEGQLALDGASGYVDLPNGIISALTNATFEAWVTWYGDSNWQRIFDFGSNAAGEDSQGNGTTYLQMTPRAGSNGRLFFESIDNPGGRAATQLAGPTALPIGEPAHIVVTYNYSGRVAKLFVDGQLVATGPIAIPLDIIPDVNNWLGRSNWPDPYFNGLFDEFRIYEGALTDFEVAVSSAAGPDRLVSGDTGALEGLEVALPDTLVLGSLQQARVLANFAEVDGVNVTGNPDTSFSTSDPSVLKVSPEGIVDAVGYGTASITASYHGQTASKSVTVTGAPGVPDEPILIHRYSFNETGGATVEDLVGDADGIIIGDATFVDGQLDLPGGAWDSTAGYVDLPNGLISGLTNLTFEAWVTWRQGSLQSWQRVFDIGSSDAGEDQQGNGVTYLQLTPRNGNGLVYYEAVDNTGGGVLTALTGQTALPTNTPTHIVATYNYAAGTARLFINGERVATGPVSLPLSSVPDVNVWLGRSQFRDPMFDGLFDEFRVWNGAMLDAQVAASYAAGPDALPGDAVSLTAELSGSELTLSWPSGATGFSLQTSAALGASANWQAVAGTPVEVNGRWTVTVPVQGAGAFYRLARQP